MRVSMGWWLLRFSAKILALLRLSVIFFSVTVICWIVIYPVDSTIQLLNNRGQTITIIMSGQVVLTEVNNGNYRDESLSLKQSW